MRGAQWHKGRRTATDVVHHGTGQRFGRYAHVLGNRVQAGLWMRRIVRHLSDPCAQRQSRHVKGRERQRECTLIMPVFDRLNKRRVHCSTVYPRIRDINPLVSRNEEDTSILSTALPIQSSYPQQLP